MRTRAESGFRRRQVHRRRLFDADLVIYDPSYRGILSAKTQHTNNDYNGFEGMEVNGRPSTVTVRGRVQVRDGKFIGERGRGRLLKRGSFAERMSGGMITSSGR